MNTSEIRLSIAQVRAALTEPGARCPKRQGLHMIGIIVHLCDALDTARLLAAHAADDQRLYAALVTDYNGIVAALRAIGIEVAQPAGSDAWHWRYGGRSGKAATIAEAYAAALNVYEELL
jgi:hypothetical protein